MTVIVLRIDWRQFVRYEENCFHTQKKDRNPCRSWYGEILKECTKKKNVLHVLSLLYIRLYIFVCKTEVTKRISFRSVCESVKENWLQFKRTSYINVSRQWYVLLVSFFPPVSQIVRFLGELFCRTRMRQEKSFSSSKIVRVSV